MSHAANEMRLSLTRWLREIYDASSLIPTETIQSPAFNASRCMPSVHPSFVDHESLRVSNAALIPSTDALWVVGLERMAGFREKTGACTLTNTPQKNHFWFHKEPFSQRTSLSYLFIIWRTFFHHKQAFVTQKGSLWNHLDKNVLLWHREAPLLLKYERIRPEVLIYWYWCEYWKYRYSIIR